MCMHREDDYRTYLLLANCCKKTMHQINNVGVLHISPRSQFVIPRAVNELSRTIECSSFKKIWGSEYKIWSSIPILIKPKSSQININIKKIDE